MDNGQVIGILQLRHTPGKSDGFPVGFENHIYYEITPSYRRLGYGIKILALGLREARKLKLEKVILTCFDDNIPSQKIIETNGGVHIETKQDSEGGMVRKYEIILLS